MSEKQQHTAAHTRELMEHRYGDGLYHKHNKMHFPYRQHCRSHPILIIDKNDKEKSLSCGTGQVHAKNLRKIRKRLDKGHYH